MQYALAHHGRPQGVVKWVLVLLILMILGFGYLAYAWMEKEITIVIDGNTIHTKSLKPTVGDVLEEKGIPIYPKDQVEPSLETQLAQEQTIKITRAFLAEVQADGKQVKVKILPATVREVLHQAGITLGEKDIVEPDLNQKVSANNAVIKVSRITEELITRKEKIGYRTEQKQDKDLERGIRRIVRRGKEGVKEETIKVTYRDGKIIGREVISSSVIVEPVSQVVAYGVLQFASRGGQRFEFERAIQVSASAYTYTGHRTCTGTIPKVGSVAVDPSVIPLGSRIYVEGYGFARAEDTGGAIKGNKIDVFLETEGEARRWGRRTVKVYILK